MPITNEKKPGIQSRCSFEPLCTAKTNSSCFTNNLLVTRTRYFKRNEALCVLNNKFRSIYIIRKGAVKAHQVDVDGREHIHAFYFTGETLGYKAIFKGHYISTVVALIDTVVCEVPYEHFVELINTKSELSKYILSLISKQLTVSSYVDMASAEQRIAAFLIDLSLRSDDAIPMERLMLPMNRQDIGSYLRLTAETVSRVLSRLQKDQVITVNHKLIHIVSPQRLQQLAQ